MIVVTAPTGNIGRHVVARLLESGAPVRVIARDPAKLTPDIRNKVEIVQGSHGDADVVDRAFKDASALFWLAPGEPFKTPEAAYLDFTRPAAQAIAHHGVKRIVSITALGRGTQWEKNAGLVTTSLEMDEMLMATGAAFRGIALPSFMDNALRSVATIREQGVMFGAYLPDKKAPKTAARDMGATAAALLADDAWAGQEEVPLLGPEDLSPNEMAAIVSDVLNREVRYQQIPYEGFKQTMMGYGMSEGFAQSTIDMFKAKDEGMDNVVRREDAERAPTTFRKWCEEELKSLILS